MTDTSPEAIDALIANLKADHVGICAIAGADPNVFKTSCLTAADTIAALRAAPEASRDRGKMVKPKPGAPAGGYAPATPSDTGAASPGLRALQPGEVPVSSAPASAPLTPAEALRLCPEVARDGFMDGAMAVHNEWVRAHAAGEAPPRVADFSEAADDYASAALARLTAPTIGGGGGGPDPVAKDYAGGPDYGDKP